MQYKSTIVSLVATLLVRHKPIFAKRLLVFAGPHKTSETSIEKFFSTFALGPGSSDPEQQALRHWVWPQLQSPDLDALGTAQYQVFDHLVTSAQSPEIQQTILNGIQQQFEMAAEVDGDEFQGMIIGSDEFDRVGPSPYSNDDAIKAVQSVVDVLPLEPANVTILLLYRVPRLEQWMSIFTFLPMELPTNKKKGSTKDDRYHEFICDPTYARNAAWDALWNSMHPLRVAERYSTHGYNVQVMDLSGIERNGLDVEHIIGCHILDAECDADGYLLNLRDKSFLQEGQEQDATTNPFPDLTEAQQADLEELFRIRDCEYNYVAKGGGGSISIAFQNQIFGKGCSVSDKEMAALLEHNNFFLNALQSQLGCNAVPVSIQDILKGTALPPKGDETYSWEYDYVAPTAQSDARPAWTMPVFLLLFIGVGAIGLAWVRRSDQRQLGQYSEPGDLVLSEPETHLSDLT